MVQHLPMCFSDQGEDQNLSTFGGVSKTDLTSKGSFTATRQPLDKVKAMTRKAAAEHFIKPGNAGVEQR